MLPTVDFFGTQVTRMIIGDNPFHANSYIPDIYPGPEMLEYYNQTNVLATMDRAWECGYNTILALASDFMLDTLKKYRAASYDVILGFTVGSVALVFPRQWPEPAALGIFLLALGLVIAFLQGRRKKS